MTSRYGFGLLAPAYAPVGRAFGHHVVDTDEYERLLGCLQRLRGETYLEDGAITSADLNTSGGLVLSDDRHCWHLMLLETGKVIGCVRLRLHSGDVTYDDLRLSESVLARDAAWGPRLRCSIEADLAAARQNGLSFVEIGGWALAKACRGTKAALDVLAASYALGELWGGCLGAATATARHGSASMLRRMGGTSFSDAGEEFPPYYDTNYGCTMELLRFTRTPAQRFAPLVAPLKRALLEVTAIVEARISARIGVRAHRLSVDVA